MLSKFFSFLITFSGILFLLPLAEKLQAQVIPVEIITNNDGSFTLLRGGEPYYINGGGGSNIALFPELAARGGNSIRTWGVDSNTPAVLDAAHANGLTVMLGLWVGHEAHGFDYNNETAIATQLANFRAAVLQYKDHPALLAWGIGNEMEVGATNMKVWDAINDIAAMIHEEDGNHPTLTITAHISVSKANTIAQRAPNLDMIGVNSYAGISSIDNRIRESNWNKPYLITEWGVSGPWEVSKTSWNAPLEPTSTQKAAQFADRYEQYIAPFYDRLLGSYAFLWDSKFEGSYTWFGLFVKEETTPMIDALQQKWGAGQPDNAAPQITGLTINNKTQNSSLIIPFAFNNLVVCQATDPDGDTLEYEFLVLPESGNDGVVITPETTLNQIPGIVSSTYGNKARLNFTAEHSSRNLRLYVFVRDGQGHVATASFPFRVQLNTADLDENLLNASQDAYVRDGEFSSTTFGTTDSQHLQVIKSDSEGETRITYIQFNLSNVNPEFHTVVLELYGTAPTGTVIEARGGATDSWSQSALTWENRTEPATNALSPASFPNNNYRWWTWNVSDFVRQQYDDGVNSVNLVIMGAETSSNGPAVFNSRENGQNRPRLRVISGGVNSITQNPREETTAIKIYPNPAADYFQVKSTETNEDSPAPASLLVYNISGQLVLIRPWSNTKKFSISHLNKGIYFIRAIDKNGMILMNEKIIKL